MTVWLLQSQTIPSFFLFVIFGITLILLALLLVGPIIILVTLFYNGIKLVRYEGWQFSNLLSLCLAISILAYYFCIPILRNFLPTQHPIVSWAIIFFGGCLFYFQFIVVLYTLSTWLNLLHPFHKQIDYIIVLGAGLMGEQVTPLLKSRIDKGIALYKHHPNSKLVFSGGKGEDELISEAEAMKRYALTQGVDAKSIIIETKSRNTWENIAFSSKLISSSEHIAIVTNYFHLLRSLMIAKQQHINCIGFGAKTRFYYTLNAYLREIIGYFVLTKRLHITVLCLIFLLSIFPYIISLWI